MVELDVIFGFERRCFYLSRLLWLLYFCVFDLLVIEVDFKFSRWYYFFEAVN